MNMKTTKCILFLFILGISTFSLHAKTINILDLGAKGDGKTDNTIIIQKAIDTCSENIGTVIIPAGNYLTRTVFMRSNVTLHLEFGATIMGDTELQPYLDAFPNRKGKESPALIHARGVENIAITGFGTIDGQGQHQNFQHGNDSKKGPIRPKIIYFQDCKNVSVQDVTLKNSAYWTQDYEGCDGVIIRGVKVFSHANYNNDGLDIDSKNVLVSDCYIDCDDDALCFKSDIGRACENITVTNCILRSNCNAIKFGTSGYSGFKNITVTNCVIQKATEDNIRQWYRTVPWLGTTDKTVISGIALEAVDGGVMEQIIVSNIVMTDVQTPIFVRLGDRKRTFTKKMSVLKDIIISNIIAKNASLVACSVTGVPEGIVENVLIKDVQITSIGGGTQAHANEQVPESIDKYPENSMFGVVLPASGFYVRHAKNIRFDNVRFRTLNPDARPMFYLDDVQEPEIIDCKMNGEKPEIKEINSRK